MADPGQAAELVPGLLILPLEAVFLPLHLILPEFSS